MTLTWQEGKFTKEERKTKHLATLIKLLTAGTSVTPSLCCISVCSIFPISTMKGWYQLLFT